MKNEYEEVHLGYGIDLEGTVETLLNYKKEGRLVCCEFNEQMFYSDTVTMDDAYLKITGKTKKDFDESQKRLKEDYDRREEEHKEAIPSLTEEWRSKARSVLSEDKLDYWDEIVPIRLSDIYHGMELGSTLDIISLLKEGKLAEAKEEFINQQHSGMSASLVFAMVREFHKDGDKFVDFVDS